MNNPDAFRMTMKTKLTSLLAVWLVATQAPLLLAQGFNSGSTGAYGPMNITADTTLDLPPDGIFHCTTINVEAGGILRFNRNALNTPVYLLATGDVTISGQIDVSGGNGTASPPIGGKGGPGGFDGGSPGFDAVPPGAGYGPGGGKGGPYTGFVENDVGSGSYATIDSRYVSTNHGATYGSPLLVPLVGGSGGGGSTGSPGLAGQGGGGGGGAILVASNTRILFDQSGQIAAYGGSGYGGIYAQGSGGAVRLVAPKIVGSSQNTIAVNTGAGQGRIRIDTLDRSGLSLSFGGQASVGAFLTVFPSPVPRLDIISAAGTSIPQGSTSPVTIQLPFGSTSNRTVTVQARDFGEQVPIRVVLTPESGVPTSYDATINNTSGNNPATATVNVVVPVNTKVAVNAWTR